MWWADQGLRSALSDRTGTSPHWETSEANGEEAGAPGFWVPLKVRGCDKPQCPPRKECQREGGELGVGRKPKGHLLANVHFRTPAWNASSESSLLPGVHGGIPKSHMPMSRLKILGRKKKELAVGLQWRAMHQAESKPRANCKSKSWTALRYSYIYIYICIFIYMLCTKVWDIRHHYTTPSPPL